MDRYGVNSIVIPIILVASLGMGIQTYAVYLKNYTFLLIGRFILAIVCDPINLAKAVLINDWFIGAEISTANAINLSFVRCIVFLSGVMTPFIAEQFSFTMSFIAGCFVCLITLIATIVLRSY